MYTVSEAIRSTHGEDGAIVLDIRQGQMFNLNFVGSRILELLETEILVHFWRCTAFNRNRRFPQTSFKPTDIIPISTKSNTAAILSLAHLLADGSMRAN